MGQSLLNLSLSSSLFKQKKSSVKEPRSNQFVSFSLWNSFAIAGLFSLFPCNTTLYLLIGGNFFLLNVGDCAQAH